MTKRPTLKTLEQAIVEGSPSLALQRPPKTAVPTPAAEPERIEVLDIQPLQIMLANAHAVSVMITSEEKPKLALVVLGEAVGLRNYGPTRDSAFAEQVIELGDSDVYGKGRRRWLTCPGLSGQDCHRRRMKLYRPPGEGTFACADCHGITIPHVPHRPLRWHDRPLDQHVLHWRDLSRLFPLRSA